MQDNEKAINRNANKAYDSIRKEIHLLLSSWESVLA